MMRQILLISVVIMMSHSFLRGAPPTPEQRFWTWFEQHKKELYDFERDRERIFDELNAAVAKVDDNLTFEFGPKRQNGKREFVISAGGVKEGFSKVESLASAAPKLERWIVIKFRSRRAPVNDVQFGKATVKAKEVKYVLFKDDDPEKIGILLLMPGYREGNNDFGNIGYLLLDEALGEYDVETRVGAIVFDGLTSKHAARAHPLSELAAHFDEHFARQNK